MERTASCSCGALSLTCRGEPVRISVCHCLECQKRTGSIFGAQARFPEAAVTMHGTAKQWARRGDTGNEVTFYFCEVCGSTVAWRLAALPGFVAVAMGGFADPGFGAPTVSIYEARAHGWVKIDGANVEHLD
jgi:hypothetical protein